MPILQLDRAGRDHEEPPCHLDLSKLIQAGTKSFFNNPLLSDIVLVCPDGRALHCHSVILAAASRRLAAALKQGNWTPGQQMPVKGVDSDALETLVCAFYTAECPLELARVPALYDAAVKLEVPSLAPALEQYTVSALQPHNCCAVLELCLGAGVGPLAELVLEWIRGRVADVVPGPEFRACRLETAALICKDLAGRSQLVGLQAAVAWLSASAARGGLVGVFAEATGLAVDAIQAVANSGGALGPIGGLGAGGAGGGLGGSGGLGGLGSSLSLHGPSHGPSLNLGGGGGAADGLGTLGLTGGAGGLGGGAGGNGSQVLQLLPPSGTGGAGVGGGGGPDDLSGLQSLLGGGAGALGVKGAGAGMAGLGGLGGLGPGLGLDALADAAEGERMQKRLRLGGPGGLGGFGALGESGSATSRDLSTALLDGPLRLGGAGGPTGRDLDLPNLTIGSGGLGGSLGAGLGGGLGGSGGLGGALGTSSGLSGGNGGGGAGGGGGRGRGRGGGGRRRRGTSASDDDEDYAPSGGRSGGSGGRSRAQELIYDADAAVVDDPTAGSGGGGSGPGEDGPSGGDGGAGGSGGPGGNIPANTPVLMTGRRTPAQKGMCHVQGCNRSLAGLRDYYQRYKICEHHLKVSQVLKDGVPHRFCQQCGRFHPLTEFDGDRRSCRTMLQRHCHRRAKQKQELAEVLAQRYEEKQVAASVTAVMAAMARGAPAGVPALPPMLQLQYLAGLPVAAAAAAAAATDDAGAKDDDGDGGGPGAGRSLPAGLHSPPSRAALTEAVQQRARKQQAAVLSQTGLLGLGLAGGGEGLPEGQLAAAMAAAAAGLSLGLDNLTSAGTAIPDSGGVAERKGGGDGGSGDVKEERAGVAGAGGHTNSAAAGRRAGGEEPASGKRLSATEGGGGGSSGAGSGGDGRDGYRPAVGGRSAPALAKDSASAPGSGPDDGGEAEDGVAEGSPTGDGAGAPETGPGDGDVTERSGQIRGATWLDCDRDGRSQSRDQQ